MKILKILEGEKELKRSSKWGFLRVLVLDESSRKQYEKAMYIEEYHLVMYKNKLIGKGYGEEDLNMLLELHQKCLHKEN